MHVSVHMFVSVNIHQYLPISVHMSISVNMFVFVYISSYLFIGVYLFIWLYLWITSTGSKINPGSTHMCPYLCTCGKYPLISVCIRPISVHISLYQHLSVHTYLYLIWKHDGQILTIFKDKIYQLTWKNHLINVYDIKNINQPIKTFNWPYEGWGITHNDTELIISDGSANLYFVKPENLSIKPTKQIKCVTINI